MQVPSAAALGWRWAAETPLPRRSSAARPCRRLLVAETDGLVNNPKVCRPGRIQDVVVVHFEISVVVGGWSRATPVHWETLSRNVIGIDLSEKAIALAREAYKQRQASGVPLFGSASFHAGDMCSILKSRVGQKVGAFFSNRVLHLLAEADFCDAARNAISYLERGACFCVSGRSPNDFDAAQMEWIPGRENEVARYKDPARTGHDIAFVTKQRLRRTVGHYLENMHYLSAAEPERVGAPDTQLLILLGRKPQTNPCGLANA